MTNALRYLLLFSAFLALGCTRDDETGPGFDMVFQETFFIPPGISVFDTHHFIRKNLQTRYQAYLQQHGKTDADIASILLEEGSLSGQFGDADLGFVQELSVRLFDGINELVYTEAGYRLPVPFDAGNSIGIIPTLADCKPFLSDDRYGIDVVLRLRNVPQLESEVRLDLRFKAVYR
jgi:hypothetical protein